MELPVHLQELLATCRKPNTFAYVRLGKNEVHLQELLATCRKLPKSDVNYMTQFAQFLLEKHSPNKN